MDDYSTEVMEDDYGVERFAVFNSDGEKVAHREQKEGSGLPGYEISDSDLSREDVDELYDQRTAEDTVDSGREDSGNGENLMEEEIEALL